MRRTTVVFVFNSKDVMHLIFLNYIQIFIYIMQEFANIDASVFFCQSTHHGWLPRGDIRYYGVEATLDVHSFNLYPGQLSEGGVWVISRGDGKPSSVNGIQLGWHVS
jgi:hypothetical protein